MPCASLSNRMVTGFASCDVTLRIRLKRKTTLNTRMKPPRSLSEIGRQKLYDLVWAKPASALSEEFGVSDVAIAKRCKKLGVPRPSRGYWAKVEAGKKLRKPPLPSTADELFYETAQKPVGHSKRLPRELSDLHPLATELLRAISSAKPDSEKRVRISQPRLPNVTVSKVSAERTAQAFHVIATEAEARTIPFRNGQSRYDGGFFRKGNDRLYLEFEEELIDKPAGGKRSTNTYGWGWQRDPRVPSGKLTISLKADRHASREAKRWTEGDELSLEKILAQAVQEICRHFIEAQKRRAREAIEQEKRRVEWEEQQKKWREQETIRQKAERERKHAEAIEKAMCHRKNDLLKAAEWWRLHEVVQEFLSACEQRWRAQQANDLTPAQHDWLEWARETAKALSPFESGYPEPEKDGAFSAISLQMGGPYPETREFSRPPTMPEIPAPVVVQQSYASHQPPPQPYPFWLKHQRG